MTDDQPTIELIKGEERLQISLTPELADLLRQVAKSRHGGPFVVAIGEAHEVPASPPTPETQLVFQRLMDLLDEQASKAKRRKSSKPETTPEPRERPQFTFEENKAMGMAFADAPHRENWIEVPGEIALRHKRRGQRHEIKLSIQRYLVYRDDAPNQAKEHRARLWQLLSQLDHRANKVANVCIAAVLENEYPSFSIDDMIKMIGWSYRTVAERDEKRRKVWQYLIALFGMTVIGDRRRVWRDDQTREKLDLVSHDPLILDAGSEPAEGQPVDIDHPPVTFTIAAGPFVAKARGDHRILSYYGDMRKLAAIPDGRPSGAWAYAIASALNQKWRERAAYTEYAFVGEDNKLTVRLKPFTRRELLAVFPPDPSVRGILNGPNPSRAKEYWTDAITTLRHYKIISFYQESGDLPQKRKGWADAWLDQELDIRPNDDGKEAIRDIRQARSAARKGKKPSKAS